MSNRAIEDLYGFAETKPISRSRSVSPTHYQHAFPPSVFRSPHFLPFRCAQANLLYCFPVSMFGSGRGLRFTTEEELMRIPGLARRGTWGNPLIKERAKANSEAQLRQPSRSNADEYRGRGGRHSSRRALPSSDSLVQRLKHR